LRTPITILKTSNEALASFGAAEDTASLNRYLRINASVLDQLDTDIERILQFNRSQEEKQLPVYEAVALRKAVLNIAQRFEMNENLDIRVVIDAAFEVITDPYMMDTILVNLIDNAIKYSTGRAKIEISAKGLSQNWQLEVRDQGQGIPGADLPYIFDRFYRVSTGDLHEVKGYGIGLTYVRQLVASLDGHIKACSEPGKGTTFKLTFRKVWKK